MKELVPAALAGERVDRVVALLTGLPRSDVAALVDAGGVRIGGRAVGARSRRVAAGDDLEVDVPAAREQAGPAAEAAVEVAVAYADDDVVVVDKAAGVVVHPGAGHAAGTLVAGLLARFPDLAGVGQPDRPGIVHRLDKGTSGLLVVARTAEAYRSLTAQLKARTVGRRYLTLVWGTVEAPAGVVDAPVGRAETDPTRMAVTARGRQARTRYEVVERFGLPAPATLLRCQLETGRTHQIRVHLAAIGHPLLGDGRYGGDRSARLAPRPFLHAAHLAFDHPRSGERLAFDSPLPDDLAAVLSRFSST
ncbi:MAG TPA: RluA family pseudouridine synthase [Acidimicrobiales bacterium]|nr:RluA family pseudouridine synthase [Acidimicrobiales bacterium]